MSEPIWCTITVAVPGAWIEGGTILRFPAGVADEDPADVAPWLENEEVEFGDLLGNGLREVTFQGHGNYGLLDDGVGRFLDYCRELGVPFIATNEQKYECEGETIVHGHVSRRFKSDNDGSAKINDHDWKLKRRELAGRVDAGWSAAELYRDLHEWLCDRLAGYTIDGLRPYGACAEALASQVTP